MSCLLFGWIFVVFVAFSLFSAKDFQSIQPGLSHVRLRDRKRMEERHKGNGRETEGRRKGDRERRKGDKWRLKGARMETEGRQKGDRGRQMQQARFQFFLSYVEATAPSGKPLPRLSVHRPCRNT